MGKGGTEPGADNDRRGADRRKSGEPYDADERRETERRSGEDRRKTPRSG